ncbi:hypothetical protein CN544_21970 [Bacillus toyonensis]|uniref:hypothetical protein n=1 Tax=Bacillus toyonensis TaxID=155322 RepID=UPI000BF07CA3|nr:hypothetical protein [Bacillus toyonensis]PEN79286.1 hypothetical protein CN544_21970 [Bacillus toyonensis]
MGKFIDLTGGKFGRLTVIEKDESKKTSYWLCNCDCGTKNKSVNGYSLRNGKTISCGCYNREIAKTRIHDISGEKFGRLTVIERVATKIKTYWICDCDCGNKRISANGYELTHGLKVSCGCIRKEKYDLTGKNSED